MGILGSIGSALGGAATGFLTGGPVGAAIGAGASLLGGRDSTNQTQSTRGTQRVQLSPWTENEQGAVNNAFTSMGQANMSPEEAQQLEAQIFASLFNPASQELSNQYNTLSGQNYSNAARRGAANTSRTVGQDRATTSAQATDQANLQAQAQLQAMQVRMQEQENRRQAAQAALNQVNSMWQNRLARSGVATTGSGQGATSTPNTTASTIFGSLGASAANGQLDGVNNWVSNLFGGGGSSFVPQNVDPANTIYDQPIGPGLIT